MEFTREPPETVQFVEELHEVVLGAVVSDCMVRFCVGEWL